MSPVNLDNLVKTKAVSVHDTRQKFNLRVPSVKSTTYGLHFQVLFNNDLEFTSQRLQDCI